VIAQTELNFARLVAEPSLQCTFKDCFCHDRTGVVIRLHCPAHGIDEDGNLDTWEVGLVPLRVWQVGDAVEFHCDAGCGAAAIIQALRYLDSSLIGTEPEWSEVDGFGIEASVGVEETNITAVAPVPLEQWTSAENVRVSSAAPAVPDEAAIRTTLELVSVPDGVIEIRVLKTGRAGTVSGYFDANHLDDAVSAIVSAASTYKRSVYVTLNPAKPTLLARAANRLAERAEATTSDRDIVRLRYLLIDVDPPRPAGVSSTDCEHDAALHLADSIRSQLAARGWPEPVIAGDSGNGGHLVFALDLENNAANVALLKRVLEGLDFYSSDDTAEVDRTTYNPARITKLYGTVARKGDATPDRPHRPSHILEAHPAAAPVPRELLEQVAGWCPAKPSITLKREANGSTLDVNAWIEEHELPIVREGTWQGGHRWILNPCPWNHDHANASAYIVQFANGAIAAGCHHNSCAGRGWRELRSLYQSRTSSGGDREPTTEDRNAASEHAVARRDGVPAFPVHVFNSFVRRLVQEGAAAVGVPPEFIAVPLLGYAAAIVGNSAYLKLKQGWNEHPVLYCCVVAKPGSGKTPAENLARYPLDVLQKQAAKRHKDQLAHYRHELAAWQTGNEGARGSEPEQPRLEHYYSTDATLEAIASMLDENTPGVAMAFDELALWVKSCDAYRGGRGGDRQKWLALWSSQPLKQDRKTQDPIYVEEPNVCVVGGIQPDMLGELNDEARRRDGFIDRILWSYPEQSTAAWSDEIVPDETKEAVVAIFRKLRTRGEHREFCLSPEAKALWVGWFNENTALMDASSGLVNGCFAKLPSQLARLALVLHVLAQPEGTPDAISADTMGAAMELIEYFREHALRVLGHFGANVEGVGGPPAGVLRALKRAAGAWVTRSDLHRRLGGHVSAESLTTELAALEAQQVVEKRPVARGERGRPAEEWRICPRERNESNEENPLPGQTEANAPTDSLRADGRGPERRASRSKKSARRNEGWYERRLRLQPPSRLHIQAIGRKHVAGRRRAFRDRPTSAKRAR
jgi:hypothetical protein